MYHVNNIAAQAFIGLIKRRLVLFFIFTFCILFCCIVFFAFSINRPYMGADLAKGDQGWAVGMVDPNGQASEAGIKAGDRPTEVNNTPADKFLEKYDDVGFVYSILIREISVVDNKGQIRSVDLQNNSQTWQSATELTALFLLCVILWSIGLFVFLKRPKNPAALLFCLTSLSIGLALASNMAAERGVPAAVHLEIIASIIGPWLLLHFFLVLPEEMVKPHSHPLIYLIYLPPFVTLILYPLIGFDNGQPLPEFRTLRLFEYGVGLLAVVVVAIADYFHSSSIRTRQQMKIVLVGCIAALIPLVGLTVLPAAIAGQPIVPFGFGILFIAFIPLAMGYAVVNQKLMDIDIIIRRSVIYGFITVVIALVLSAAIFPFMAFRGSLNIAAEILVALALGAVATALFGPTKRGIETLVDKLFYKDRYDYRQIIQSMSTSLNSLKDFADISRLIVGTTVQTLNLAGGCLFTKQQSELFDVSAAQGTFTNFEKLKLLTIMISKRTRQIEFPNSASTASPEVAFLIPLVAGEKEVGVLCLSQKVSRQAFSSNDIYLLQGLVSVAAVALRSAMLTRDVSLRDTFVSIASHELRTPLTSIIGYAGLLLKRDPTGATRKQWLQYIVDNGQMISDMVDELLNVTRIQSGRINMKLEGVNLINVVKERLALVRESTSRHEIKIDIEAGLPEIIVDRDKFGQVLGNLLSNAVKYSPNGGCITVAGRNEPSRHRVVVSIADQGIGISPEDQASLFTTFHRIQRPETQAIRGSGLGLYIVKEWTEVMGGEIWLESEMNKGSTFFVAFPASNSKKMN
jgi:nitrogen-specific signal transduction histidine kinase